MDRRVEECRQDTTCNLEGSVGHEQSHSSRSGMGSSEERIGESEDQGITPPPELGREMLELIASEDETLSHLARQFGIPRADLQKALDQEGLVPARKRVRDAIAHGVSFEEIVSWALLKPDRVQHYWDLHYAKEATSNAEDDREDALDRANVPALHSLVSKRVLHNLYVVQNKSEDEIAQLYGQASANATRQALSHYGLPIKPQGSPQEIDRWRALHKRL